MNGRPRRTIRDLLFGGGDDDLDEREIEETEGIREEASTEQGKTWDRPSLYVAVVERAINNIQETPGELGLLTDEEWRLLRSIGKLEYCSRFVLIRLLLRKPGRWYNMDSLKKYTGEVGSDGLEAAFEQLCSYKVLAPAEMDVHGNEIIDLTGDSDDEDSAQPVAGPSKLDEDQVRLNYFCRGEEDLPTLEGLRILNADRVKVLCKMMKIKHTKLNKDGMITALINHASTQSVLTLEPVTKSKGKGKGKARDGLCQTILPFSTAKIGPAQTAQLRKLMLNYVGKSIRVNPHLHTLMARLHIIWLRDTEYPESLFLSALLAGFKKRVYAEFQHVRDPDIWRTREQYLEYETGLRVEAEVDEMLKPEPKFQHAAKTPAPVLITPGLDFMRSLTTPARTPGVEADVPAPNDEEVPLDFDVVEDTPAQQKARLVKKIFEEHVLPKWTELVAAASAAAPDTVRKPGLERFEPGYVYTRIVRKCLAALATLKEFAFEKEILDSLLAQRFWRRRSRAKWYERRALLQMNYLYKNSDGTKDMDVLWEAREGIVEALEDDDTATIMRPKLIARLQRVEKTLKMTAVEKAKYDDVVLRKPDEVSFNAVRVWNQPDSIKLDGRLTVKGKENKTEDGPSNDIAKYFGAATEDADAPKAEGSNAAPKKQVPWHWTGKSLWQGKDGTCNVETRALQYYETHGFRGFHSETQILTTLFALLFWDIIFAPIPGAFETPWQTGPLDIGEDSFYYARRDCIEKRLAEIKDGRARTILEENDGRHREAKTCCIGVNWKMCGREELIEIVECLGGDVLSAICRLFCEDYGGRSSGVPDLIVWNSEKKECKFVEVKGPGDHPQENQKMWFDALLNAQCSVEICNVVDPKNKKKTKTKTAAKKTPKPRAKPMSSTSRGKARREAASVESEAEELEGSQVPVDIDLDGDEAWEPSTEMRDPLPPREGKRRRRANDDDDDELPLFTPPLDPEPSSSHHPPPALTRKRCAENLSTPGPSKKRKI
ncbi:VRR-NUC domain-containing protein [Mycena maculata]|uniref:Fanconi-associated nuclease n=1 Tax=Mycena maculata TaxID=230809 RepID=A0AAD7NRF2_9AGAR|nr:VRR-NUC domain-containing protein [Mycena maculata]